VVFPEHRSTYPAERFHLGSIFYRFSLAAICFGLAPRFPGAGILLQEAKEHQRSGLKLAVAWWLLPELRSLSGRQEIGGLVEGQMSMGHILGIVRASNDWLAHHHCELFG